MKKLILIAVIILGITTAQAQDSTHFTPNYGIELEGYSDVKTFADETLNLQVEIKFMTPIFEANRVIFTYDVKTYNDSILVKHKKKHMIKVPLDAEIQGKKVYEWLNIIFECDTAKAKLISEKLYYYELKNN